jgi:hypothetical protein
MLMNIPSVALRQLVQLSERKEALMAEMMELDREMTRLQKHFTSSSTISKRKGRRPVLRPTKAARKRNKKLARPGQLKAKVLRLVKRSGRRGITIADLSRKLKMKNQNLFVWFNVTGRKVPGLKKIGTARYRLT